MNVEAVSPKSAAFQTNSKDNENRIHSPLEPLRRISNSAVASGAVAVGAGAAATLLIQRAWSWGTRPRLRISFDPQQERYNEEIDGRQWLRFKVTNKGLDTALGVVAEVQRVFKIVDGREKEDTSFRTTVLQCLRKEEEKETKDTDSGVPLHRGQCEYWGLLNKACEGNAFAISTYRDMVHKRMGKPLEFVEGTYVMEVYVFAERQKPSKSRFMVENKGKNGISVEKLEEAPVANDLRLLDPRFSPMRIG